MKRHISLLLTVCMILAILPTPLFAEDLTDSENGTPVVENDTVVQEEPSASSDVEEAPAVSEETDPVELLSGTIVASGDCGKDLVWKLDDAGTLTISGSGKMYDYTSETAPWYDHRANITSLVLESGFLSVPTGPFQNLPALTTVSFSDTVENVDSHSFSGCTALTAFAVDADNADYCAVDGVLMTTSYRYLVCYPSGRTDTFYAVPDGVEYIYNDAFNNVSALTTISLPASLRSIDAKVFDGCPNLAEIHYAGTETLWNMIAPNGLNTDAVITFGNSDMKGSCGPSATYTFNAETGAMTVSGSGIIDDLPGSLIHVRTIFIGPDLTDFQTLFSCFPLLESVEVDPSNANLISIDSDLYRCDKNGDPISLLGYPAQKTDTSFTIPDTVTDLVYAAFAGCTYLQELTIPASVTEIHTYCFSGEASLTSITVDEDNQTYASDNGVLLHEGALQYYPSGKTDSTYSIPSGTRWLHNGLFGVCPALTELRIPLSVSHLGPYLFGNQLPNLATIVYEGTEDTWNRMLDGQDLSAYTDAVVTFENSTIVTGQCGDNATYTMDLAAGTLFISGTGSMYDYGSSFYAPWYNKAIQSVVIESGITSIDGFRSMDTVKTISLADTITTIDVYEFEWCTELTTVILPARLERIEAWAFYDCRNLQSIYIPASTEWIASDAFWRCTSLAAFSVDSGNAYYCAVDGVLMNKEQTKLCCYPAGKPTTAYAIPEGVVDIDFNAFYIATKLETLSLPASLPWRDSLAYDWFRGCTSLTAFSVDSGNADYCAVDGILMSKDQTVLCCYPAGKPDAAYTVPAGVEEIDSYAFWGADDLETLSLPLSLDWIGIYTFYYCDNLTSVSYAGTEALWDYVTVNKYNEPLLNASFTFGTVSTVTGSCGEDATFALDISTGKATISSTGACDDISDEWYDYAELVTSLTVESGITEIPLDMYEELANLTELALSETVTELKYSNLNACCPVLSTITVHEDNPSYRTVDNVLFTKGMSQLLVYPAGKQTAVYTIPETVKTIVQYAFRNNEALTTLILPAALKDFESRAIYNCDNLQNILLDSSNTNFVCDGNVALMQDDMFLFYCPGSLQSSYTVPEGIAYIEAYAFYYATNLKTISLPITLEDVVSNAFLGCKALETVIYPGTEAYWDYAVSVNTGRGSTYFLDAEYIFGTIDTVSDTCGNNLEWSLALTPGELVISGTGEMAKRTWPCDRVQTVVLEEGITSISANAFSDATLLREVTIPASVTVIETDAFQNCSALETVYYGGSEPQWSLVSVDKGNTLLHMADFVFDSSLMVEWNTNHTVLCLSGEVDNAVTIMAAFYDAKGQMQLVKQYTASQVKSGVGISDSTADLTQCTAKVMLLDENYAPVGVPYTPDAQKYTYVTAWLYATEDAYIDGKAFADAGTLLFSDDTNVYTADAALFELGVLDLGRQYILTTDPATGEVLDAEESGASVVKSYTQYDLADADISTSVPCLIFDAAGTGVPFQMDVDTLDELMDIVTSDLYHTIDRDGDGEIDYLLVEPYLYGMVSKTGTSTKYGDYFRLTDPAGNAMEFNGVNLNWYLDEMTDLKKLPEAGAILKLSWDMAEQVYHVEILSPKVAQFEAYSIKTGHRFNGKWYYPAENGWVTTSSLTKDLLAEYFRIVTDGEVLVYAELTAIEPLDAATLFTDGATIDED